MKTIGKTVRSFVVVATLVLVCHVQAAAPACQNIKINATGVGQDLGGGRTVAQISGGGLLQGTTEGNFTITGGSFPVFTIAGTVKFTTHQGTLTVTVTGTFDVSTGEFTASGSVTDATGKLAGASGTLSFAGVEDLSTGAFVENVTGQICVDLRP